MCDVMCAAPLCCSLQKEPKERGDLPVLLVSSGLSWWAGYGMVLAHVICKVCGGGHVGVVGREGLALVTLSYT